MWIYDFLRRVWDSLENNPLLYLQDDDNEHDLTPRCSEVSYDSDSTISTVSCDSP